MEELTTLKERRYALCSIVISTILYLLLFPLFSGIFYMALMVTGNLHIKIIQLMLFFLSLCIPLSIPISIFFMWFRFFQRHYLKARFHTWVPVFIAVINSTLVGLIYGVVSSFTNYYAAVQALKV